MSARTLPGTLARAWEIARVLGAHLVFHKVNRHRKKALGMRMREACERLGTTFIKMGQLLSTRYELLGKEDRDELKRLLDAVPPFPYAQVREIVRHDLGAYPEKIFKEFEPEPVASASIAQVHRAWLKDGRKVAVKVRRPYIGRKIAQDIRIARALVRAACLFSPTLRRVDALSSIEELSGALLQEIDLRVEAAHLRKAREYYTQVFERGIRRDLGRLYVPMLHEKFSSYNVLTTEFLDGVPLSRHECMREPYDPALSASTLVNTCMRFLMERDTFVFQADNHLANYIALEGGGIGVVDFGMIGYLDPTATRKIRELMICAYVGDSERALRLLLDICELDYGTYAPVIRDDVVDFVADAKHKPMGFWFVSLLGIFMRHGLKFPASLSLFGRCYITLDGILAEISPGSSTKDIAGEELSRGVRTHLLAQMRDADFLPLAYTLSAQAKECPRRVAMLVERYADDPLRMVRDIRTGI